MTTSPKTARSIDSRLRWVVPVLLGCVFVAMSLMLAKYQILTAAEIAPRHAWQQALLRASLRLFGATPLAVRLPGLLLVGIGFSVLLVLAIWVLARYLDGMIAAVIVILFSMTVFAWQVLSVRHIRNERRAFSYMCHKVEQSVAPGELLLVDDPLFLEPFRWYAPDELQPQIEAMPYDFEPYAEIVLITAPGSKTAETFVRAGYTLHEDDNPSAAHFADLAPGLAHADTRIYFASRSVAVEGSAISSR